MPATEKTWRDNRTMHVIFALSSVLLLAATVWMLVADHFGRDWKGITDRTIGLDTWMQKHRRIELLTRDYFEKQQELEERLSEIRATPPDKNQLDKFVKIAKDCAGDMPEGAVDYKALQVELDRLGKKLKGKLKDVDGERVDLKHAQDAVTKAHGKLEKATADLEQARKAAEKAGKSKAKDARKQLVAALEKVKELAELIADLHQQLKSAEEAAETARESKLDKERIASHDRDELMDALRKVISRIKTYEDNKDAKRKVQSANLDEARSKFDIANAGDASAEEVERLQKKVDLVNNDVAELIDVVETAKEYRDRLKEIVTTLTAEEETVTTQITAHNAALSALQKQFDEGRDSVLKQILALPVLDIFGKGDKVIRQHWIPAKTLNFNFSMVARFDRCITCHRSMEKTYGSPTTPAYLPESHIIVTLRTPATAPELDLDHRSLGLHFSDEQLDQLRSEEEDSVAAESQIRREVMLMQAYGMKLVQGGPLNQDDVAVSFAWPKSLAAEAGLQTGDIIERINGDDARKLGDALTKLVDTVDWGRPLTLAVRRGVPNPYSSHPRLDLFGTAASPHPFGKMGCTLCHDGQGSATDFINPVHVPNSEAQRAEWGKKYGWYKNHHWPFPMYPARFREAACLKCHHDVTELEPSQRFPEPPAPKVVAGYNLVRRYGCFGCHEINGFDGPAKRIGPDLRAEPNYTSTAKQILFQLPERLPPLVEKQKAFAKALAELEAALTELNKNENAPQPKVESAEAAVAAKRAEVQAISQRVAEWHLADEKARAVVESPQDNTSRRRLLEVLDFDAKRLKSDPLGFTFSAATRKVASVLQDTDTPGAFRRVGPSLRHVGEKLSIEFLTAWLEDPTHFRPTTRMPRFFGLHDHMQGEVDRKTKQLEQLELEEADEESLTAAEDGLERAIDKLQEAQRYERLEIRAIAYYLLKNSQPFTRVEQTTAPKTAPGTPQRNFAAADAARGKRLFAVRGCLACHSHSDHPKSTADQGPDLSQIGAKLRMTGEKGRRWLYSWVRQPNKYHARTVMPDLFLDDSPPLEDGTPTDAAADITTYLMNSGDWTPKNAAQANWPPLADLAALDTRSAQVRDDLESLTELTRIHLEKALRSKRVSDDFLRAALSSKPEDQKTAARIARKFAADELALRGLTATNRAEKMLDYIGRRTISHRGCFGCHDVPGYEDSKPIGTGLADWGRKDPSKLAYEQIGGYLDHQDEGHGDRDHSNHGSGDGASLDDFFIRGLVSHHEVTRESFLWQKLREPRSFDYNKTENKGYLDQLRMPQFNFTSDQREQIMTFVLGLVAEPPGDQFVYKPSPRRKAILEGSKVVAQFNCAGCHQMSMDRWTLSYKPGDFSSIPQSSADYSFLDHHFTDQEIKASRKQDRAGKLHVDLVGRPTYEDKSGLPAWYDDDGAPVARPNEDNEPDEPVKFRFTLWEETLLEGRVLRVGRSIDVPREQVVMHPGVGGGLARLLESRLLVEAEAANKMSPARRQEISGSIPPPLVGEGRKVQGDWLHDFMLAPYRIRPAAELRMPHFTMSSAEATKIVDYFKALDNAEYPYEADPRTRELEQKKLDREYLVQLTASLSKPDFDKRFADNQETYYGNQDLRLGDAMRIVVNQDFCVTCHRVGDFTPPAKPDSGQAPNLADVGRRLRPDYVRRWIANPKRTLPYTGMPQNVKPFEPLRQSLYHGNSEQQVDALVDLLMNFDRYMNRRTSIGGMVPPPKEEVSAPKKDAPPP